MEFKPFDNPWVKRIRLLTVYLVISISINIFLITAVAYFTWNTCGYEEKLAKNPSHYESGASNAKALNQYFLMSFPELVKELADKTLLQDGYTKRDLALACLVNYHFFDIEKALSGSYLQKRRLTFVHKDGGEMFNVEVFPGLGDREYQMLFAFIQQHKHPLTAEGLFQELKKKRSEPSLSLAFFGTHEFYALFYSLNQVVPTSSLPKGFFNHGEGTRISQERLLNMLLEGNWSEIAAFTQEQQRAPERTRENLRDFLKKYVKLGSQTAASIWITLEEEYLLRQLDDANLILLIATCRENSLYTQLFLKKVLCSVRSDLVRKSAGLKLYAFEGVVPNSYDQTEAMKKFLPTLFSEKDNPAIEEEVKPQSEKTHIVQTGDSLWKIAKKYGITIDELKDANELDHEFLKPGQVLKVCPPRQGAKGGI